MHEVRSSVEPRPRFEPESGAGIGSAATDGFSAGSGTGIAEPPQPSSQAEPALDEGLGAEPEDVYGDDADRAVDADVESPADETEGARLIALNMALNGTPREETQRYLSENFSLLDADRLLDEVYASVES